MTVFNIYLYYIRPSSSYIFGYTSECNQEGVPDRSVYQRICRRANISITNRQTDVVLVYSSRVIGSKQRAESKCGALYLALVYKSYFTSRNIDVVQFQSHLGVHMWRSFTKLLAENGMRWKPIKCSPHACSSDPSTHVIDMSPGMVPDRRDLRPFVYEVSEDNQVYLGVVLIVDGKSVHLLARYHWEKGNDTSRLSKLALKRSREYMEKQSKIIARLNGADKINPLVMETVMMCGYLAICEIDEGRPQLVNATLSSTYITPEVGEQLLKAVQFFSSDSSTTIEFSSKTESPWSSIFSPEMPTFE